MCLDNKEFCDVWTDIHCNYGHLLIDRSRMCLDHTEFLRRVDRRNGHLLTDRLILQHVPPHIRAAHCRPSPSITSSPIQSFRCRLRAGYGLGSTPQSGAGELFPIPHN
ncbi:hypothetical protein Q8A67_012893 [Cirrhinus molitorella]|uniref:Uncharacterized protein n=1 Tax=Cirrhinus molitorella TaxID=172907 RepID=A0AA88TKA4_9TELE|nr:hypothetical protein Q8A67_012893 [Cirrhinus molitorella]